MSKPAGAIAGSEFRVSDFGFAGAEVAVAAFEEAVEGADTFAASGAMGSPRISGATTSAAGFWPQPLNSVAATSIRTKAGFISPHSYSPLRVMPTPIPRHTHSHPTCHPRLAGAPPIDACRQAGSRPGPGL